MGISLEKVPNVAISNTECERNGSEEHPINQARTAMPDIPMDYYHRGVVGASFGDASILVRA